MTDKCSGCQFWKRGYRHSASPWNWIEITGGDPRLSDPFGECRVEPPVVLTATPNGATKQRRTHQDDWCGHFAAIPMPPTGVV